jgi:hypothetical protein
MTHPRILPMLAPRALAGLLGLGGVILATSAYAQDPPPAPAAPEVKAERCIMLSAIDRTTVVDGQTILFRMKGGKTYRNTLPYKCPQLGFEERFLIKTSINQLCNTDIITVLTSFGSGLQEGASCGLGLFVPEPEKPRDAPKP